MALFFWAQYPDFIANQFGVINFRAIFGHSHEPSHTLNGKMDQPVQTPTPPPPQQSNQSSNSQSPKSPRHGSSAQKQVSHSSEVGVNADWIRYSISDRKLSVLFPAPPSENLKTENGIVYHVVQLLQSPRMYILTYSDEPQRDLNYDVGARIKQERDDFLKGVDSYLVSQRDVKVKRGSAELPALEFIAQSSQATYKCILGIDNAGKYMVAFGSLNGADSTAQMKRFLESLNLN